MSFPSHTSASKPAVFFIEKRRSASATVLSLSPIVANISCRKAASDTRITKRSPISFSDSAASAITSASEYASIRPMHSMPDCRISR